MAPRGPRPALLLTLGLLAAGLALASGPPWVELNRIFRQHHVDYPRPPVPIPGNYCNRLMRARGLYWTPLNTFVHAPTQTINSICSRNGVNVPTGLRQSIRSIPVTTCRYDPRTRSYIPRSYYRRIVIGCWNGIAVYFQEEMWNLG